MPILHSFTNIIHLVTGIYYMLPFCILPDCSSPIYCINGGTCYEQGSLYSCACTTGYEGNNCQFV